MRLPVKVSVDPGLRACGVAVWHDGLLIAAFLVANPVVFDRGEIAHKTLAARIAFRLQEYDVHEIIFERPFKYPGANFMGAVVNAELDELSGVIKWTIVQFKKPKPLIVKYKPREWKGTVDKSVMLRRIRSRLSAEEEANITECKVDEWCGKGMPDVLDAIGVGLHHFGRRLI